jgi:hypothetical protein
MLIDTQAYIGMRDGTVTTRCFHGTRLMRSCSRSTVTFTWSYGASSTPELHPRSAHQSSHPRSACVEHCMQSIPHRGLQDPERERQSIGGHAKRKGASKTATEI